MIRIRGIIILMTLVQHKTPLPGFKQHDPDSDQWSSYDNKVCLRQWSWKVEVTCEARVGQTRQLPLLSRSPRCAGSTCLCSPSGTYLEVFQGCHRNKHHPCHHHHYHYHYRHHSHHQSSSQFSAIMNELWRARWTNFLLSEYSDTSIWAARCTIHARCPPHHHHHHRPPPHHHHHRRRLHHHRQHDHITFLSWNSPHYAILSSSLFLCKATTYLLWALSRWSRGSRWLFWTAREPSNRN